MARPLTPLGLTVLRMLSDKPMHPYEMQQRIRDHGYDQAVKVTHGSLYHAVERLTATELIEPMETSREGRRPERTVYAITEAGHDAAYARMREILTDLDREYPLFGTALAFITLLPEAEVARLLRSRTVLLEAKVAGHGAAFDALRKQGLERYKLIDFEYHQTLERAQLDYVRALADDLETGRLTWEDRPAINPGPPGMGER